MEKQPQKWSYELTKRKLSSGVGYAVELKANLIGENNRRMDIRIIVEGNGQVWENFGNKALGIPNGRVEG